MKKHVVLLLPSLLLGLTLMPVTARAACSDGNVTGSGGICCFSPDSDAIGNACRTPTTGSASPKDDLVGICNADLTCGTRPTTYAVNAQSYSAGMSGSCRVSSVRIRIRLKQVAGTRLMNAGGSAGNYQLGPVDSFVTLSREDILNSRLP
jgi:hypothetical protein